MPASPRTSTDPLQAIEWGSQRLPSAKLRLTRRRDLLRYSIFAPLGGTRLARAQTKGVRRIGVLSPGPILRPEQYRGVWDPLRDRGWREGENLSFERRWAEGRPERLKPL